MKKITFILCLLSAANFAQAASFGKGDHIYPIQDINMISPNNLPMQLANRVTGFYVFAGVYAKDNGYVLIEKGNTEQFWELPESDIKQYQADGTLPTPLPKYTIPIWDYLLGYSLWIIIVGVFLYYWIKEKFFTDAPVADESRMG